MLHTTDVQVLLSVGIPSASDRDADGLAQNSTDISNILSHRYDSTDI